MNVWTCAFKLKKKKYIYKNILIYMYVLSPDFLKKCWKKLLFYLLIFIIWSFWCRYNYFVLIIALFALISVCLLIYFCTMVASSNRLTNNAVRFALDRQRIEHFSYHFVWCSQNLLSRYKLKISQYVKILVTSI